VSEGPYRGIDHDAVRTGWGGEDYPGRCSVVLVRAGFLRVGASAIPPGRALFFPPGAEPPPSPPSSVRASRADFPRSALDADYLAAGAAWILSLLYPAPHPRLAEGGSGAAVPVVMRLAPPDFAEAVRIFEGIEAEAARGAPGSRAMARLRLAELVMLAFRSPSCSRGARRDAGLDLDAVLAFLRERSSEELSLPGIAARFGVNPAYLSRAFSAREGLPLVEYLNRTRISKACALLKRSSLSVLEIAYAVGYANLSHFNRVFRRIAGMSPREFRRANAG